MTNEFLSAISMVTLAVAVSAVLLAVVAVRRSRQRIDGDIQQRLDAYQTVLEETESRLRALERRGDVQSPAENGPQSSRHAEIGNLARQGLDSIEIARRTGMDVGEVELTVSLIRSGSGR